MGKLMKLPVKIPGRAGCLISPDTIVIGGAAPAVLAKIGMAGR